jgi:hypothetical protein
MTAPLPPYLTSPELKTLALFPGQYVEAIESEDPGWVDAQLIAWSRAIDARLAKRYETPFLVPAPMMVQLWLARIMGERVYLKRGIDATDGQYQLIAADSAAAWTEIREAADAKDGLFELPLREDLTEGGVTKGAPIGVGEQSPYAWTTKQRLAAADED